MTWRGAVFLLEERLEVQAAAEECLLMYQWPYALWQQGVKATWDGRIVDDERVALAPQWSLPRRTGRHRGRRGSSRFRPNAAVGDSARRRWDSHPPEVDWPT